MLGALSAAAFALLGAAPAHAAGLDISVEHRLRALSYKNVDLVPGSHQGASFLSQSTRLGFTFKDIPLGDAAGEPQTLDILLKIRALGVTGSTTTFSPPFDRAAAQYPSATYVPFLENAALAAHGLGGIPWDITIGRQSYTQGSGLLLDDEGAGLSGVSLRGALPWWDMKAEGFAFEADHPMQGSGALDLFGGTLEVPSEGSWQLNQLIERDKRDQTVAPNGCPSGGTTGCAVSGATRWFSSLHYHMHYGPIVFDGEGALERGAATPTGPNAAQNHITFKGNAEVVKAKWIQTFYHSKTTGRQVQGYARVSFARGSGDDAATPTTDESFFPSHGKRYDGLEREGFGQLFAATPYDAFAGRSTGTVSGLPAGSSGIISLGLGVTPPAWKGLVLDVDYYLYQADRGGSTAALGKELDLRLHHDIRDRFSISASAALFSGGALYGDASARRYMLEAVGRF
ncbi:MAG: hypothetical protein KGL53_04805 [Elusimicrobia bacterium]|nr:hypothetical protein [Elusimicrobiota bacterium]